jgi:hypothetical protein
MAKSKKNPLDFSGMWSKALQPRDAGGKFAKSENKILRTIGELKFVDQSLAEIQEKKDKTPVEIINPSPTELDEQLNEGVCTLFFYKITDGTMRRMRCTLQDKDPVATKYNKQGVMAVWDLDASEWRSFYPNRVFKLIRNEKTDIQ